MRTHACHAVYLSAAHPVQYNLLPLLLHNAIEAIWLPSSYHPLLHMDLGRALRAGARLIKAEAVVDECCVLRPAALLMVAQQHACGGAKMQACESEAERQQRADVRAWMLLSCGACDPCG